MLSKLPHYWFLLLVPLFIFSCQNAENTTAQKRNIKEFYFPTDKLFDGLVYEYQSVDGPHDPPFYWYYRTLNIEGDIFFTGMYYDYNFTPFQFIREEVFSNGMALKDFYWYQTDSLTGKQDKIPVNIKSGNVFPFEVSNPPGVVVSNINWKIPEDSTATITFIRNRQFDGDTTIMFNGQEYPAIKMNVLELIDHEQIGHLEQEYKAKEVYAKELGLVYSVKNIAPQWQLKYKLVARYSMEEFLNKSGADLTPNLSQEE